MKLYRQKLYSDLERNVVKQFLGRLSGFVHKAKSLHWAAEGKDIHEYLDGIWEETYKFQDTIAEGFMGIDGKLDSDIPFLMPEAKSPEDFISELEEKVEEFYSQLPDLAKFKGLSGEIESFIQTIEKYKYLFSLCGKNNVAKEEREFAEKSKLNWGTRMDLKIINHNNKKLDGNCNDNIKQYKKALKDPNLSDKQKEILSNLIDKEKLAAGKMTEDEYISKYPKAAKKKYRK